MNEEELERKLKRERIEVCLNCKKFVDCDDIGKFVECADYDEVEDEAWVIRNLDELHNQGGPYSSKKQLSRSQREF